MIRKAHIFSGVFGLFCCLPLGRAETIEPEKIEALPGFVVERIYVVPREEQGSWVSITTDPEGRFYACDQGGKGLFRVTVRAEGSASVERVEVVDPARPDRPLSGAQGLLWAFDSLWFQQNGGGLYRLTDTDDDGILDKGESIPSAGSGGEHGVHAVILTEDKQALYLDAGNHTPLPEFSATRVQSWSEDLLEGRIWDPRHARGVHAPGGWVTRFNPESQEQEVICIGFRNQFDITLNRFGDIFTFDADMEWDFGLPWYRRTRICQVASGADYGWRSGSGKWPAYYEDSLPSVVDIGPGSPTGVVAGKGTKFPAAYQEALFALDWTFGTIYAVHLQEHGAGYQGRAEPFVYGAPLPLTDTIVGQDGALYFLIGGRGAESALYRVRYEGEESTAARAEPVVDRKAAEARKVRRALERFHGREHAEAIGEAWPHLSSKDRFLRHAARVAVESQPVEHWADRVYGEPDAQARITGAVALARAAGEVGERGFQAAAPVKNSEEIRGKLLASLIELDPASLSEREVLGLLRAYALTFLRLGDPAEEERRAIIGQISPHLPSSSGDLNTELIRVLAHLREPSVVEKAMRLIANPGELKVPDWAELAGRNPRYGGRITDMLSNHPPTREIGYAFLLRNMRNGWTLDQRRGYFSFLNEAAQRSGGASYSSFLSDIRAEALASCTDEERIALTDITGEDFQPVPAFEITMPEGPGREWTVESALEEFQKRSKANFENGRNLFFATACGACHRMGSLGGAIGPDLTSVPNKFDARYVIEAIVDPNKDISDQYSSSIVTMEDGTIHAGLVLERGKELEIYSMDPDAEPVIVSKADVNTVRASIVSQMPPGLINGLNGEELNDLVTYLMAGGNPEARVYR